MTDDVLRGIRILDLTRLMPFAYGTQLLADAGADIVKVEPPGGEYGRGMHESFRLTNRGKRSIELDLRNPADLAALLELVASVDVLVESFRPGVLERAGAGYDVVSAINPRLVYVSATGYAFDGPRAEKPGHDITYAAIAGLLSVDGGTPTFADTPYIDMIAGWGLASTVLLGLIESLRSGAGSHRHVSMADMALSLNVLGVAAVNASRGHTREVAGALAGYPWPELMRGECPCYGIVTTKDGRQLALANVEPKFWTAFIDAIGLPELADDRFALGVQGRAVRNRIADVIATRTRDEWMALFDSVDVCVSDVNSSALAIEDEEFAPLVGQVDGEVIVASPLARDRGAARSTRVPEAGEHTQAVRHEFYARRGRNVE